MAALHLLYYTRNAIIAMGGGAGAVVGPLVAVVWLCNPRALTPLRVSIFSDVA